MYPVYKGTFERRHGEPSGYSELRDMEDLGRVVEQGAERRRAALPKVQEIVESEVEGFCAWERSLALGPAIIGVATLLFLLSLLRKKI